MNTENLLSQQISDLDVNKFNIGDDTEINPVTGKFHLVNKLTKPLTQHCVVTTPTNLTCCKQILIDSYCCNGTNSTICLYENTLDKKLKLAPKIYSSNVNNKKYPNFIDFNDIQIIDLCDSLENLNYPFYDGCNDDGNTRKLKMKNFKKNRRVRKYNKLQMPNSFSDTSIGSNLRKYSIKIVSSKSSNFEEIISKQLKIFDSPEGGGVDQIIDDIKPSKLILKTELSPCSSSFSKSETNIFDKKLTPIYDVVSLNNLTEAEIFPGTNMNDLSKNQILNKILDDDKILTDL